MRIKKIDIRKSSREKNKNTIIFEKKKSGIKSGVRIIRFLAICGVVLIMLSNIVMKIQYDKLYYQVSEYDFNKEMVILDYTKVVDKISQSLVSISNEKEKLLQNTYFDKNITGVVIDNNGSILTNYLVAEEYEEIFVKLPSEGTMPIKAQIVIANEELDLAIIKIAAEEELEPIKFAEEDQIREGQEIVIMGNAIGDEYIGSVIPGVITAKDQKIQGDDKQQYSLLQISAPINKYNAGGAICNSEGELVGIATSSITERINDSGLYYGLQLSELETTINSTKTINTILGINDGAFITYSSKGEKGFYIQELDKNGKLFQAGINPTDIIIKIDNENFSRIEDMIEFLREKKDGDTLECTVLSKGNVKIIEIVLVK